MKEENKKKNEELQSRRQFFKKAGKAALPILGAIAIANVPLMAKATGNSSACGYGDCSYSCSGGCEGCSGSCRGDCSQVCSNNCYTACKGLGQQSY